MKIGIDIRTLMDKQPSGVSEYTLYLVKEILAQDKENKYKLFYNSFKDVSGRMPKFASDNVEIIKMQYPNKIFNYLMQKMLRWPKIDRLMDVDVFFMPHINFISLSGQAKSILTIHDLSFLRYPEFFSFRKNFWHRMVNVKKLARQFDKIVTLSENTKRDVVELLGLPEEKVKVIYSGVNYESRIINYEEEGLDGARKNFNLPDKFILYLGNVEPRKNVEGVINAYGELRDNNKNLADYKLVIAGGKGWKSKNIFKTWQASQYKNDINFLGYINEKDKPYLYKLASVFVYPSFYEGFGFPLLEAMTCGTPVVTSFSSSLPEIAGKAALMIDPYDINAISTAIEQVLTDESLKKDLIANGMKRVKKFSWEKAAVEYLELFRELI